MRINLKVWRQTSAATEGEFKNYAISDVQPDLSFLEVLDILNEQINCRKWRTRRI